MGRGRGRGRGPGRGGRVVAWPRTRPFPPGRDEAAVFGPRWLAVHILDMLVNTLMIAGKGGDAEDRNGCAMCGAVHEPVTWADVARGRREEWAWLRAAPGVEGACGEWLCWRCVERAFPAPKAPGAIHCPACGRGPCTLFVVTEWGTM